MPDKNILVVDDEEIMREVLKNTLENEGYSVSTAEDGIDALKVFREFPAPVVVTDIQMSGLDGIGLLQKIKDLRPQTMVIIMTAYGTVETAVAALRHGAFDYITKPFIENEIRVTVRNAFMQSELVRENISLKEQLQSQFHFKNIIGQSERMQQVYRLIEKVSRSDTNVLITGESGTGKELVAHAIHYNSNRSDFPFVSVNCSAIPDTLMESEMFGHVKGSFTSAVATKLGLFEEADSGTLFLDEIADLSLFTQAKLLRAIQTGEIKPVGSNKTKQIDARIISATNKKLFTEVQNQNFREDLYYRLNVVNIPLPSLRERSQDIPELTEHFVQKYSEKYDLSPKSLTKDSIRILMSFSWPGNVRELENCIERALALCDGDMITPDDLPPYLTQAVHVDIPTVSAEGIDLDSQLNLYEQDLITQALTLTGGNISRAAELLKTNRRTLSSRIHRLGINAKSKEILYRRKL